MIKKKIIDHGFTVANIAIIIVLILILWGILYGAKIAPQVRSTANQVANLNNLQKVNVNCVVHPLARTISCVGTI